MMDELVHDLSLALEETKAKSSDSISTVSDLRTCRPKSSKGKTRRRHFPNNSHSDHGIGNISEASESSLDEALKDYKVIVNLCASDSDEMSIMCSDPPAKPSTLPLSSHLMVVESDSVTDSVSQLRPHRRRRKFKHMAIDPIVPVPSTSSSNGRLEKKRHKRSPKRPKDSTILNDDAEMKCDSIDQQFMEQDGITATVTTYLKLGKRKRTYKYSGTSVDHDLLENTCEAMSTVLSSSSLSSSDSDTGFITFDEGGRDGDDEQSDFFHESGPSSGIPGFVPWWENPNHENEASRPNFEKLFAGSFHQMANSSFFDYKSQLNKVMNIHGREITAGRRKITDRNHSYSMSRFLQERQQWKESMHKKYSNSPSSVTLPSHHNGEYCKRRRRHNDQSSECSS
ncbi:G patch domain-containing protein 2-like [Tubulanus polymorphus]|uniref:G patch domain-containing protein 2-like n=1 Tax=Tubulanus polymorphus TaxID=672921 RepID=UPI003DA6AAC2